MWYIIYIYVYIYIRIYIYTRIYRITVSLFWMKHRPIGRSVKACSASFSSHAPNSAQGCADSKGQIVNLDALITSYIITIYHNIQPENLKDSCFWLFSPWKNHASHSIHRWSRCKVKWAIGLASASYIWGTAFHGTARSKVSAKFPSQFSKMFLTSWNSDGVTGKEEHDRSSLMKNGFLLKSPIQKHGALPILTVAGSRCAKCPGVHR